MDLDIEILLKEQDMARDLYREQRAIQDTYTKLFVGLIIAIVTFIVKGDLPLKTFVIVSTIQLISAVYLLHVSYRKRCCAGAYIIAEQTLVERLREKYPNRNLFNLTPIRKYLRDSTDGRQRSRFINVILISVYMFSYAFFMHIGLSDFELSKPIHTLLFISSLLVIAGLGFVSIQMNKSQKKRYSTLLDKMNINIRVDEELRHVD